ncbi:MAG: FtsX-like permease family protein [Dethiobacter sp.]|nr:FtsX-like permease family protein [Dethiobacter sp.]
MFQAYNLVQELTAYENILLPVLLDKKKPDEKYVSMLIELLKIEDRLHHRKYLESYFSSFFYPAIGNIVTTTAGLNALGFDLPYAALSVTLAESPNAAMEEYLETNLSLIAARSPGVKLFSYVALARENRETAYGLLIAAGAVVTLFFAICASMVSNALSARIRASKREIGTIRAVGASEREVLSSYLWQLASMFAWGTAIGMAVQLTLCGWLLTKGYITAGKALPPVWQPLLFVAVLFGICFLNVRSKVVNIVRRSIVENIREL